jgi:hypothetical protein
MTGAEMGVALAAGAVVGAVVYGRYAVAKERWRRIKRDTKAQWRGLRTLWKMLRRAGRDVAASAALVLLAVALAVYVIVRGAS